MEHDSNKQAPSACRPEAYFQFQNALTRLTTTKGLWDAAFALSLHALDDLDQERVEGQIESLVEQGIHQLRPASSFDARWARLHELLFEQEGFGGDSHSYYNPINSYVPAVLASRRGIPITLCLIYKVIGERFGLTIRGVNAPGHFLVRVYDGSTGILVDPFHEGQVLSTDEALQRISQIIGVRYSEDCLREASHRDWITRILGNLRQTFLRAQRETDLRAMNELNALLQQ